MQANSAELVHETTESLYQGLTPEEQHEEYERKLVEYEIKKKEYELMVAYHEGMEAMTAAMERGGTQQDQEEAYNTAHAAACARLADQTAQYEQESGYKPPVDLVERVEKRMKEQELSVMSHEQEYCEPKASFTYNGLEPAQYQEVQQARDPYQEATIVQNTVSVAELPQTIQTVPYPIETTYVTTTTATPPVIQETVQQLQHQHIIQPLQTTSTFTKESATTPQLHSFQSPISHLSHQQHNTYSPVARSAYVPSEVTQISEPARSYYSLPSQSNVSPQTYSSGNTYVPQSSVSATKTYTPIYEEHSYNPVSPIYSGAYVSAASVVETTPSSFTSTYASSPSFFQNSRSVPIYSSNKAFFPHVDVLPTISARGEGRGSVNDMSSVGVSHAASRKSFHQTKSKKIRGCCGSK